MYGSTPWTTDPCPMTSDSDDTSVADDLAWMVAPCLPWQGLRSLQPRYASVEPSNSLWGLSTLSRRVGFSGSALHSDLKMRQEDPCSSIE